MNRLAEAVQKLNELWNELPRSAYRVYEKLGETRLLIPYYIRDEPGFTEDDPVNAFGEEIELIIFTVSSKYKEREDEPITRKDEIGHLIDKLRVKMRAFVEYAGIKSVLACAMERIENKLEKVSNIFPDRLEFKKSIENLQKDLHEKIPPETINHLNDALDLFNQGKYSDVIRNCGIIGEILTNVFRDYLRFFGIEIGKSNWYSELDTIKAKLGEGRNNTGRSLGTTKRLEWFLLFLLFNIYWLRNAASHSAEDEGLPDWMGKYKAEIVKSVEFARTAMLCILQAANILNSLVRNL